MGDKESNLLAWCVHYVLLIGVTASALCLVIGIPMTIHDRQVQTRAAQSSAEVDAAKNSVVPYGEAILRFGLLILMATPIFRVLALALGWGFEREFRLMAVAISVLALLALSILLSVRA